MGGGQVDGDEKSFIKHALPSYKILAFTMAAIGLKLSDVSSSKTASFS